MITTILLVETGEREREKRASHIENEWCPGERERERERRRERERERTEDRDVT